MSVRFPLHTALSLRCLGYTRDVASAVTGVGWYVLERLESSKPHPRLAHVRREVRDTPPPFAVFATPEVLAAADAFGKLRRRPLQL